MLDFPLRKHSGAYSYPTPGSGSVRPHAVSSISGTVTGVANPKYLYDPNGNMTCEYTGATCIGFGAARETDTYWSFNMAHSITQGTSIVSLTYDSEHHPACALEA